MDKYGRIFLVLIILMVCAVGNVYAEAYPNEPDGFRGLRWGDDVKANKDLKFMRSDSNDKDLKFYTRKNEKLELGAAKLQQVFYVVWRNRLMGILIVFDSKNYGDAIKNVVFERFGPGKKDDKVFTETRYVWQGDITGIKLEYSSYKMEGQLAFASFNFVSKMVAADEEKKNKKKEDALKRTKNGARIDF